MFKKYLAAALPLLLAACTQKTAADSASNTAAAPASTSTPASAGPAPAPAAPVDIAKSAVVPVNTTETQAEPLLVAASHVLQFAIPAPQAGDVVGVEVQLGTYAGTSDGRLTAKVCQAGKCAEGSASVDGAKDNEFFTIALGQRLPVAAQAPLDVSIRRDDGSKELAVWMLNSKVPMTLPGGTTASKAPNIGLRYETAEAPKAE